MKIGIVNDLPMAAEALRRVLTLAPEHQLAWIARDGAEAVELCLKDTPDLLLMDLIMPRMDGVEATRQIMTQTPCAILIVTAGVDANAARVFAAMGHGALDAVDTPLLGSGDLLSGAQPLLVKIRSIARLIGDGAPSGPRTTRQGRAASSNQTLLAIGASAGGPAALAAVLEALPVALPATVVIIQHVDARFAAGMADWLGQHSALPVRLAKEGDRLVPGEVLVAGTDDHLIFSERDRLGYVAQPADHPYRPSVDVFFRSIADGWSGSTIGVLLTGMGSDGAKGLKALRTEGHHTIAQDQATSAVYGMPKAAAALSAATEILPLERIAPRLTSLVAAAAPLKRGTVR
jgi:two-component system response regulator WspF